MDRTSTPGRTATPSSMASRHRDDNTSTNDALSQGSPSPSLSSSTTNSNDDSPAPCWLLCWYLLSWCVSIVTYVAEGFVVVWVAVHYVTFDLYLTAGLTLSFYFVSSLINSGISLFWYYDLDRVSVRRLEESGPFHGTYKRKCSFAAIASHCLFLGHLYR